MAPTVPDSPQHHSSFIPATSTPSTRLSPSSELLTPSTARSSELFTPCSTTRSSELCTPSSTTRQRLTVLVVMGPCNWQGKGGFQCPCTSGSCTSDLDASRASYDYCDHPMSKHTDYVESLAPSTSTIPHSALLLPAILRRE